MRQLICPVPTCRSKRYRERRIVSAEQVRGLREMKLAIGAILAHVLVQAVICSNVTVENPVYLIISPRVYRPGTTVKLGINLFGGKPCDVEIILQTANNLRTYSRAKDNFVPNKPGELELKVPSNISSDLEIRGVVCGDNTETKKVERQILRDKIFIQTDKPIYKPGQKVRIRIIAVNSELKPFGSKVSKVTIEEPSGSKIMKWNDVQLHDGIASLELQLSKEPVLGKWKISAVVVELSTTTEIEIAKYVLPKFDLVIKPPPYLALDQKEVTTTICARYTYGKDVKGNMTALLCLKEKSLWLWSSYSRDIVCHNITREISGCTEITLNRDDLGLSRIGYLYYHSIKLYIEASVVETATDVKLSAKASSSKMVESSVKLYFTKAPIRFKPGFPLKINVKVTRLDGTLVTGRELEVSIAKGTQFDYWRSSFYYEKFTVRNGLVVVVVKNIPHNAKYLYFTVTLTGVYSSIYHTSSLLYSPSLSYVEVTRQDHGPAKVNSQGALKIRYNIRHDTPRDIDFHYNILCKGNLVHSGMVTRHLEFTQEKNYTNASAPQTTVPPTTEAEDLSKSRLAEFQLKFPVTQDMVPSCRVLVYYVRTDKETVADSIIFDVEDRFENQVSVKFQEYEKKPGDKTKLVLQAKPGSRVAFGVLDQSVLLLRRANDFTKTQIIDMWNQFDVGRTMWFDDRCSWWQKPDYVDASESFNMAGVTFLSNLNIFAQNCETTTTHPPTTQQPTWLPHSWPARTWLPTTEPPHTEPTHIHGPYTELQIEIQPVHARIIETPVREAPTPKVQKLRNQPKPIRIRKNFPETWLWTDLRLNESTGVTTIEVQVPDTITTWIANGFAMSSTYGMGISDRTKMKAYKPFFVQMTLPYSVIRGEEIPVTVSVFNYMTSCVPVKLELNHKSPNYTVTSYHIKKVCVCGDDAESVKFNIIPKTIGRISLTVKAQTSNAKLCPSTTIVAGDAVTRKLLVEPEGIKQEYTRGSLVCPKDGHNETFDLSFPQETIPGSVLTTVFLIGDIMGSAMSNLDSLLAMPYGCGEQNMAKFAPNIYIMDYLTNTDQVNEKIKDEAVNYMVSGYQRELTYKRTSGSYSTWGDSDPRGSMMLTAFVVRSFARARKYIFVDEEQIEDSIKWFERKQRYSGCFPNYGQVFDNRLQGGINSELTITAYVTVALLETGRNSKDSMVARALGCIVKQIRSINDSYTTALVTYTLVLAKHPEATKMLKILKTKAISKDGQMYWSTSSDSPTPQTPFRRSPWSQTTQSSDVETTGYALLALLKDPNYLVDAIRIVKWLTKQRNYRGGFSSTQDTCVALQSLSEVAQKLYKTDVSRRLEASVKIKDVFRRDFVITENNKLVLQRAEIPERLMPNKLEIAAKGGGCALLQATVKYNVPIPKEVPAFKLKVDVRRRRAADDEEKTACYPLRLKITAKWLKKDVSNMAIIDVKLVTGFTVTEDSLQRLYNDPHINFRRYDIDGQNVILYFAEIKDMRFSFDIHQSTLAKKLKPAVVRAYDYYDPESQAKVVYEITERDCYGDKIEKECPKCLSTADLTELFDKYINCTSYLSRTKSRRGLIKIRKAYIKFNKKQRPLDLPYEIPDFCPCEAIYVGTPSLMFAQKNFVKKSEAGSSIVLNSETIIAKWSSTGKRMKKIFKEKMGQLYRKCGRGG